MKYIIILAFSITLFIFSCTNNEKDNTPPVITLEGLNPYYLQKDSTFTEPGYSATDDIDGDISDNVEVTGTIDSSKEGTYYKYYNVKDEEGNSAEEKVREIQVVVF